MIRCLIIDDEPLALQQLASYVKNVPFLQLEASCLSAVEARGIIDAQPVDAVFIDINMPDVNGLDFVRSLPEPPLVVFTTAYSQYAVEGFKVDAVDYLLKPFGQDEFYRAALRLKQRHELMTALVPAPAVTATLPAVPAEPAADTLFLKADHRVLQVHVADICYIMGMSEYLKIFLDGQKPIVALLSMKRIEQWLPAQQFMRIHRSYIINLKKIREVGRSRVLINDDTYLPIGDNYREQFAAYINARFLH